MPNWCRNILQISGLPKDLAAFKKAAVGFSPWHEPKPDEKPNVLNFHNLMPIPGDILKAGYSWAGYNWEIANWGCKWGACRSWIESDESGEISYMFETAWSPPLKFLMHISRAWAGLRFGITYMDEVPNFSGEATISAGKMEMFKERTEEEEQAKED